MTQILKHLPGILLLIINWLLIKKFSLGNQIIDFMLLFVLTGCEYFIILLTHKILKLFGLKTSLKNITFDILLQTGLLLFVFALLPLVFINASITLTIVTILFYPLSFWYNRLYTKSDKFKRNVDIVFYIGLVGLPIAFYITNALPDDFGMPLIFLYAAIIFSAKTVPYAYELIVENKNSVAL